MNACLSLAGRGLWFPLSIRKKKERGEFMSGLLLILALIVGVFMAIFCIIVWRFDKYVGAISKCIDIINKEIDNIYKEIAFLDKQIQEVDDRK